MKKEKKSGIKYSAEHNKCWQILNNAFYIIAVAIFAIYIITSKIDVFASGDIDDSETDFLTYEETENLINTVHSMRTQEVDFSVNALSEMSDDEIEKAILEIQNMNFGKSANTDEVIENPLDYLHENFGKTTDEYGVETHIINRSFFTTMEDHKRAHNNCTLTAFYNVMAFYKQYNGGQYSKLPSFNSKARAYIGENMKSQKDRDFDTSEVYGNLLDPMPDNLYNLIEKNATALGYDYNTSKGLSVTKNNNMVINVWKECGYTNIASSNNYVFTTQGALDFIDKKRPFLFSFASGVYYDHTVAVFGYKTYTNLRTREKYTFLIVADGWSHNSRYLAWTNTGAMYLGCFTSITTPNYNPAFK